MDALVYSGSEKMLDISLIDPDLERLAGILNHYNTKQRNAVATALRHEEHLKESIANISHDLRTPLTVILGHLQLLQKSSLTTEQEERISTILHKAQRMKELVGTFYELSIWDVEKSIPKSEKINLTNLLTNLLTENAPSFENRKIYPEIILPEHSVLLLSDRNMLERIFQNLLTNVIRYSAGETKISLSLTEKGGIMFKTENMVQDAGELEPERMFERFYTGDKSRHEESTGLGLAVVKILTEKLGGEISAILESNFLTITLKFENFKK